MARPPRAPAAVTLPLGGVDSGLRAEPDDAVALALTATRAFLNERTQQGGTAWRLAELDDGAARVAARLHGDRAEPVDVPPAPLGGPAGAVPQSDGRTALVAVVPLGRLTAAQAELIAGTVPELQITPCRSIALPDLPDVSAADRLTAAGLVLDPGSAWLRVTACAGLPGCAKSRADVRADATAAVTTRTLPAAGPRQHWP